MKLKKELRAVKEINEQERKKRHDPPSSGNGHQGHHQGSQSHQQHGQQQGTQQRSPTENGMNGGVNPGVQQGSLSANGGVMSGSNGSQMGQSNHSLDPASMHHHSMANMMQR